DCLDKWVAETQGWTHNGQIWKNKYGQTRELPWFSDSITDAMDLMEEIWEHDSASISKYRIRKYSIGLFHSMMGPRQLFENDSLPILICKTYIWFKDYLKKKNDTHH